MQAKRPLQTNFIVNVINSSNTECHPSRREFSAKFLNIFAITQRFTLVGIQITGQSFCMGAEKFSLLRKILKAIGLSDEAAEDIVERILDFLAPKQGAGPQEFPYLVRDDFLSSVEQSFCRVLRDVLSDRLMICPKVALGDLFFAKTGDPRQNRIALNRIDRKHLDFLLCEPKTLRPVVAMELDDKSHEREERKEQDKFVEGVSQTRTSRRSG